MARASIHCASIGLGSRSANAVRFTERFCHCRSGRSSMNDITRQFEAMQRMTFVPSSAALTDNLRRFWDIQDRLLNNMEKFANGWFERRHIGSRAAQEAAQRMCKAQAADDLVREYQEWVTGAFQRIGERWPCLSAVRWCVCRGT